MLEEKEREGNMWRGKKGKMSGCEGSVGEWACQTSPRVEFGSSGSIHYFLSQIYILIRPRYNG